MNAFKHLLMIGGLLIYGLVATAQVPAGANWQLAKEGNSIKVYTASASSGLKYIKVIAELDGTLKRVSTIFRDIAHQKDWVYGTRKSFLVKQIDGHQLLYYNETALPWPVSNRDIAATMKFIEDTIHHLLQIIQKDEPGAVPIHKGIVRVPHMSGDWHFRETGKGKLHVEYYLDINPGGSLPAWVVNMFVTKGPYETFVNLQKLLNRE